MDRLGDWHVDAAHPDHRVCGDPMTEQRAGGRGVIKCHYCQRPVSFSTGTPTHLDLTPLCSQGSVVRWSERDVND
jgi:hypothetical protein